MKHALCAALLSLSVAACFAQNRSAIAIRDARIVTVSGPVLPKATVVIRDGLIEAVGENISVPADAWIIDGPGLTVYPGLIDSLSTIGIPESAVAQAPAAGRGPGQAPGTPAPAQTPAPPANPPSQGPEDRPSNSSWIRAADLVRANDRRIESFRNLGFTTAVAFPTRGIFAGQGAVINLSGERLGQMIVAAPVGQYMTLPSTARGGGGGGGGGFPTSLMGAIAYMRQVFLDADHYKLAQARYAKNPSGMRRPAYDRALEGVLESPRILLPAARDIDVDRMIRFSAELKRPAVLYVGHAAYKTAEVLKSSSTPILVSLRWPEAPRDSDPDAPVTLRVLELREQAPSTPAILAKSGVRFALYPDGMATARDLQRAIRRALDAGLTQDQLIRSLTLSPAEIFGVADRVGSIDKGKIANLVVTRGDLFQEKTKIEYVFVDGAKFQPAPEATEEATTR